MTNPQPLRIAALVRFSVLAAISFAPSSTTKAQDPPVVFLHGIQSNGSVWDFAANNLSQRLRMTPVKPSIDWTRREPEQASQLGSILNGNPLTANSSLRFPFVTRSNGGLASREFSRGDARLRQLATVATPHTGAELANNWLNYNTANYSVNLSNAIYVPIDFYYTYDPEPPATLDFAYAIATPIAFLAAGIDALMCPLAGLCVVWDGVNFVAAPVVHEMAEGSQALQQLNAPSNLTRESGAITRRIGLWTELDPIDAIFVLLSDNPDDWSNARGASTILYFQLYDYYSDHWDSFLAAYSPLWLEGMAWLIDMDAAWQELIGTLGWYTRFIDPETGYFYSQMGVVPSDGVVPYNSAEYPGGTRSQQIPGNLAHTKQASSQVVTDALYDVLRNDFLIDPRNPPPPSGSYWVNIGGPTTMRPGNTCYWYASTNVADASYQWSADGNVVGTGSELWYSATSSFTLNVLASNSQGHSASHSISVSVSNENGDCHFQ
ncbi:MAG: hypothetical protein WD825_04670 [Gemmatimonadaceae bacterium]